ncbi:MAG: tRNA (adenosine(37)-N6)-dimethylallyltransferase MiaA [Hyphomicrobiaceae bacterium]
MTIAACTAILIAGPTASGKSALALDLARQRGGVIINADSMQVYRELRILTARPSEHEERSAPHRLYGHVSAADAYSVTRWLADVETALAEARDLGLCPIIVGGTGLYFKALTEGLSPVPPVPSEVRERWRAEARERPEHLHEMLRQRDPIMAQRLGGSDVQRITRALEVIDATGASLAEWQSRPGDPLVRAETCERVLVVRPRAELHSRCDRRFDEMMAMGALDEVRALGQMNLPSELPAMRALGVAPLMAHLGGHLTLAEAVERAKTETRQYVKRQETWVRKFMRDWPTREL